MRIRHSIHRASQQTSTFSFRELAVWKTKLPSVKHAILPPSNSRPNPRVTDSMVYVSVFSPGAVCALERRSGKLLWRKALPALVGAAVYLSGGKLFAKNAHTLYALEPESGELRWSFCPYGTAHERIYSSPTLYRNRVFIGDRCGFLHCLDAGSGQLIWRQRTNRAKNGDVNSTPVVMKGLVIVGTNARRAVAYDAESGELAWIRRLDGPSVFGPLIYRDFVVLVTDSIYLLKAADGKVSRHFGWKGKRVSAAGTSDENIVGVLRGKLPPYEESQVVGFNEIGIQFSTSYRAFCPYLRCVPKSKLIYISHLQGLDLCRSGNGEVASKIKLSGQGHGVGLVDVKQSTIYALTGKGHVYALRHPRA
ncbi:MAG: PQQ-binding-like beta-propeller repeat protein [Candidatus Acidiferrales bacterium]